MINKQGKIILFVALGALCLAGLGIGLYFGVFRKSSSGDMHNSDLHNIFYGMDYTPLNSQYPWCTTTQDHVTADIAVLSQLTTRVRLYGTDCNQTEFVLNAIQKLKVDMTLMMGVWLDTNQTTNSRQLAQMYSVLQNYPTNLFEGIYVGNEVLFREDMTESQLVSIISAVKTNVTSMNLSVKLPIGTSEMGSKWSSTLSQAVDIVGANIHPYFSGETSSFVLI